VNKSLVIIYLLFYPIYSIQILKFIHLNMGVDIILVMTTKTTPIIDIWLQEIKVKPSTERVYKYHLKKYEASEGLDMETLIEEAEQEELNTIRPLKRQINQHLTNYRKYLEEQGYSPSHIRIAVSTVKTFYRDHQVDVPSKRRRQTPPQEQIKAEDIPDKDDIRQALKHCSTKIQAIIVTMASSGMGRSDVLSLTVKDFLTATKAPLELPINIWQIRDTIHHEAIIPRYDIVRVKTSRPYTCFASSESVDYILDYLEKYPKISSDLDNPLFPMKFDSLAVYLYLLNKKIFNGRKVGRQAFFRSHALRKFFVKQMSRAGLPSMSIQRLLGHSITDLKERYFKTDVELLYNQYLGAVDSVTFTQEVEPVVITNERLKEMEKMKKDMAIMKAELERVGREKMIKELPHPK